MRYLLDLNGATSFLDPAQSFFGSDGLHYSSAALATLTDAELAAIGVTKVADAPAAVPQVVSRMQAKMALQNAGLLASVESTVAAGTEATKIYWADAPDFHRDHPVLLSLATALALSSAQVDALFTAASVIT
jgi:CRP-like cAMP-binding protein